MAASRPGAAPGSSTNSAAAWTLGPMLPGGNWPSARWRRASAAVISATARSSGVPKSIRTVGTPVTITRAWAPTASAMRSAAKSLSITASTPRQAPSSDRTTGMPPPPPATTTYPAPDRAEMAPASMGAIGRGEGTTRRYPRPASSVMAHPRRAWRAAASERLKNGPIGLVGSARAGSAGSTSTWVTIDTAPGISWRHTSCRARQMRLPSAPWVMAPRVNRGRAGTRSADSSCWMARLPTWGPLPWTMTIPQPLRISDRTEWAMARALAYCSSRVPRWSWRVRALPPRARTAIPAKGLRSSGFGLVGGRASRPEGPPIAEQVFL